MEGWIRDLGDSSDVVGFLGVEEDAGMLVELSGDSSEETRCFGMVPNCSSVKY